MALEQAALRRLALKVLAQHAGPAASPEAIAAAVSRAYDALARVSSPIIGQLGIDSITGRAVHLTQRTYPWLRSAREREPAEGPFAHITASLQRQDPAVATEAAAVVFTTLIGLLVTFIGESLTAGLLRKAWPDAVADASAREIDA